MTNPTTPQITIALVGNQNCGKTTLYNLLTNSHQKVGNWPGVTMEQKAGTYKKDKCVHIVDTPGTYSLNPFTPDEAVTANFITSGQADILINIVDSTNLQRNLYLTTQLLELGKKMVVALNMTDEAEKYGIQIDTTKLQQIFGCKFICISASKNKGVDQLMDYCLNKTITPAKPLPLPNNLPPEKKAVLTQDKLKQILSQCVKIQPRQKPTLTQKIDNVVLNKFLAFPIFALVMSLVFYLSIDGIGGWATNLITEKLTPLLQEFATQLLDKSNIPWLTSLVADAIIGGVMGVVAFVPQICLLFGLIALLEGSGYMSRIAFVMDKLLHAIGLGGKGFVCFVLGCGCSVPAITAGRTIKAVNERHATITLAPLTPCSAKMAVISFFTTRILGGNSWFAISFYFVSLFAIVVGALIIKLIGNKRQNEDIFLQELPPYRLPTLQSVVKQMWHKGKSFITKAGTTIFVASVVIWFLQSFNFRLQMVSAENSILAFVGKIVAPLFYPLGFNDMGCGWQFSVATLSGIVAKETVVSTLEILLPSGIENSISTFGGYVFVIYNLLTVPCVAAISASFAEQGHKQAMRSILLQLSLSYLLCLLIYQSHLLLLQNKVAFAVIAIVAAVVLTVCLFAKSPTKSSCQKCPTCTKEGCVSQ